MARKKKNPAARYAFLALGLAGLSCVLTALLGAARGLIALDMFPGQTADALTLPLQISLGLIVLGLAAYALMTPDTIRRFLTGRQARYGSNSLIMVLAFTGILIVVNLLAFQNPNFLGAPWDLTEDKSNTLAPETLQALVTLPESVKVTAFYSINLNRSSAEDLLARFKDNSNGKLDYEFIDPDQNPIAAREAGVTGDGKILLVMGDRREIASFASETELTETLIRDQPRGARALLPARTRGSSPGRGRPGSDRTVHRQADFGIQELHDPSDQPAGGESNSRGCAGDSHRRSSETGFKNRGHDLEKVPRRGRIVGDHGGSPDLDGIRRVAGSVGGIPEAGLGNHTQRRRHFRSLKPTTLERDLHLRQRTSHHAKFVSKLFGGHAASAKHQHLPNTSRERCAHTAHIHLG